ncbi:LysR substrate-binding domain-containing protein [Pseudovibrio sp. SPO723]|uniref:LysR substrate-binding domain-containing protein n=1 Tax=Nesiotobacter zosterae TaxID=392721 RepID=UPI0029C43A46|nr:LysR substrate-binding domain-containing protein [Pseudovibrio sp. SPO723]MDX5594829.1 LysR substrate-binding domain-containing protein [Pseudovibrio sp. SPO723]
MGRLPPLNALVAFRAVMETGSLVSAAQKLSITASAVSHRLKALEDHLGLELFVRRSRAVFPTAAAYRYFAEISEAFDRISAATRTIESVGNKDLLSIHGPSGFTSRWLLGRLKSFATQTPEISVTLTSTEVSGVSNDGRFDLEFIRGVDVPNGFEGISLGKEKYRPLISPELLDTIGYPKKPADLLKVPTISSRYCPIKWQDWYEAAGVEDPVPNEVMSFESSALSLDAAIEGLGITLESSLLSADAEAAGKLVPLFPEYQSVFSSYRLIWREKRGGEPKIRRFVGWLEEQLSGRGDGGEAVTRYKDGARQSADVEEMAN